MRPRIYIATPSHDHKFHAGFVFSLLGLFLKQPYSLHFAKVGGMGVARARNNMAQEFLAGDADVYFAIDADIVFEVEQVKRVVEAAIRTQAVVCGLYALKQDKLEWCINLLAGETADQETGLQKVACAGTGFMAIPRSVFVKMIEAHPELAYAEDIPNARGRTRWDFFSMGVSNGRYLSEDYFFCHRARAMGIPVYVDTAVTLKHEGIIAFPLNQETELDALRTEVEDLKEKIKPQDSQPVAAVSEKTEGRVWPESYNLPEDHCADVLAGCYDVAYSPPEPPVILDIGANVGAFARFAAQRWPGATIFCYEPDEANFKRLCATLGSGLKLKGTACPFAVLDKAGKAILRQAITNCGAHSLFDTGEVGDAGSEVKTIDAAGLPLADILKIDAEGAELPILNRLKAVGRLRDFAAIMLEYHSDSDSAAIQTLLGRHGFRLVYGNVRCKDRGELKFLREA